MNPMTHIAKGLIGEIVHVFARGGHRFTGQLVKVADDGQALRLTNEHDGLTPIDFYVDLDAVVAISIKGAAK